MQVKAHRSQSCAQSQAGGGPYMTSFLTSSHMGQEQTSHILQQEQFKWLEAKDGVASAWRGHQKREV